MLNCEATSSIENPRFSNFNSYLNFYNRQKHLGSPHSPTNSSKFHANLFIRPINMHANHAFNYFIDF